MVFLTNSLERLQNHVLIFLGLCMYVCMYVSMSNRDLKHSWSQGNWKLIENYSQRYVTSCVFVDRNRTSCWLISRTIILRCLSGIFPFHRSVTSVWLAAPARAAGSVWQSSELRWCADRLRNTVYSTLKMLVRGAPETSARIYQTLLHFPEDGGNCIYHPPVNNDLETLKLCVWNLVGKYITVRTRLCMQHK